MYLRNDGELHSLLDHKEGWLKEISVKGSRPISERQDELIREAYLRTVSREPSAHELAIGREHLAAAKDSRAALAALRDLLWALINTKEFMLNH